MELLPALNRRLFLKTVKENPLWDVIVIGGGATGLGIALDSASRGYATLLLEQSDFAKGTSSRSTKLIHGGVRYLAQGNIGLVYAALRERGLLLKNAAHLVKRQAFIIPCYGLFSQIKYLTGLKIYDWLSGGLSLGGSKFLNRKETARELPGINNTNLAGGILYYDGQFDDARLAINIAQTAAEKGGVLLNYFKVVRLIKEHNKVAGVAAIDKETGEEYTIRSKVVINATGVYVDDILQMDTAGTRPLVHTSQGIHLVVAKSFLSGGSAMMIPETTDGRVLFAVPWQNHVLIGTTDTPVDERSVEPEALDKEISFVLNTVKQYLTAAPSRSDVLSVFAGLRPLAVPTKKTNSTKEISRDHKLIVSASGLITITGGKWTTYRKMAEETVNKAIGIGALKFAACTTKTISIHGCTAAYIENHLSVYGSDVEQVLQLTRITPSLEKTLVPPFPYTEAEVVWAVRNEMARTVEDVLARRLRILFLNARAAINAAPRAAALMAAELGYDEAWQRAQVNEFTKLATQYLLTSGKAQEAGA
ncbi:MAG TPA: glycerol-3-phosphate dehydrogenase/oxidase [Flavisolibacter sp.]|nr:glycerol-3-phosphate dehydrogenase/oxidase [Flavisolibacter sp.]